MSLENSCFCLSVARLLLIWRIYPIFYLVNDSAIYEGNVGERKVGKEMYDRGIAGRLDDWTLWVQSLDAKGIFTSDRNEEDTLDCRSGSDEGKR